VRWAVLLAVASAGCVFDVSGLPITSDEDMAAPADFAGADFELVIVPDLAGVDLAGADLASADLASADLASADLTIAPMPDLRLPDLAMPDLTPTCNAAAPPSTVGPGPDLSITISGVQLNGGGNVARIAAGSTFSLTANWSLKQVAGCPNCVDQIIVGVAPSDPQTCLYDGVPSGNKTGTTTVNLTAPTTPGNYTLRFHYGQAANCTDAVNNWWTINGAPDSSEDFAALCVY
jgi:hypothetical protein